MKDRGTGCTNGCIISVVVLWLFAIFVAFQFLGGLVSILAR